MPAASTLTQVPYWLWPAAALAGVLLAVGGLSYAPDGRINILLVWFLWAALPLLGTVVSVLMTLHTGRRPWVVRVLRVSPYWRPTAGQRWHLLWVVQALWALSALSLLLTFLILLVFTDLAFGWSSTVIASSDGVAQWVSWVTWPWRGFWAAAVPSAEVLSATRFIRIDQGASGVTEAAAWWPFLLASVMFYNLLPRLLLFGYCWLRWRITVRRGVDAIAVDDVLPTDTVDFAEVKEGLLAEWASAEAIYWEQSAPFPTTASKRIYQLGQASWQQDQAIWEELKGLRPEALLWHVSAGRSPVAELGDMIDEAQRVWQPAQALLAHHDSTTLPERHLASWRAFARQHSLVWITL
ncbi:MAG: DUF2868 domain-containing protein [Natronospirillum sp.]